MKKGTKSQTDGSIQDHIPAAQVAGPPSCTKNGRKNVFAETLDNVAIPTRCQQPLKPLRLVVCCIFQCLHNGHFLPTFREGGVPPPRDITRQSIREIKYASSMTTRTGLGQGSVPPTRHIHVTYVPTLYTKRFRGRLCVAGRTKLCGGSSTRTSSWRSGSQLSL